MAGIIAQLTRAARIRRDRRTYGTNKCLYTLQPFDTNGFQASLHNKYCVQKARWEDHLRNMKEEEEIIINAYRQYKREERAQLESERRSVALRCLEVVLFTSMILTIPLFLLATEFLFYFGTLHIDTALLGNLIKSK